MHKTTNYHSFSLKLLQLLESSVILKLGCFVTVIHCNTIFNHRYTYGTGDSGESSTLHTNIQTLSSIGYHHHLHPLASSTSMSQQCYSETEILFINIL